jgi:hypothetical protein
MDNGCLEKGVPYNMAQCVINFFEIVEVDHRDCYFILISLGMGQGNV